MSTLLLKTFLKEMFKNPYAWGWGFFFTSFWLSLGAFVYSAGVPAGLPAEAYLSYAGSWFSMCLVYSFSALAVSIVNSVYYSSFSLRYLTKYTALSSSRYYAVSLASTTIFFTVFLALLGLETSLLYSYRFGVPLTPRNPAGLALASALSTVFIYVFSSFIAYLVLVLRKPKLVAFASYLPLITSYALLFLQLYLDIGYAVVISPLNAINSLLYHYYTGVDVPKGPLASSGRAPATISPLHLWVSLLSWTFSLALLNVALVERQRGVSVEELRQL